MKIVSREYKAMLDPTRFYDRGSAVEEFWGELAELAETTRATAQGAFDEVEDRTVHFLDTPDLTLRKNDLVLRLRSGKGADELTLKCRSDDRYVAAGTDVRPAPGLEGDPASKFEEDIAPPFRCRFSHSSTVTLGRDVPGTVDEAAAIFPMLGTLRHDGRALGGEVPLPAVHRITAFEDVFTGPRLRFPGMGPGGEDESADAALIIWSNRRSGRPLVAEFSFRIKDKKERFSRELARAARSFFEVILAHDWFRADAPTKTEYVYRDTRGD